MSTEEIGKVVVYTEKDVLDAKEAGAREALEVASKLIPVARVPLEVREAWKNQVFIRWKEIQSWVTN